MHRNTLIAQASELELPGHQYRGGCVAAKYLPIALKYAIKRQQLASNIGSSLYRKYIVRAYTGTGARARL